MKNFIPLAIMLSVMLGAATSGAQEAPNMAQVEAFDIALGSSVAPLSLAPGSHLRFTGSVTYTPDGTSWDAATENASGTRRDGGLIDAEASGLVLRERNEEQGSYTYEATPTPSQTCLSLNYSSPCLVLRLPALAAARRRDLGEFREELGGTLHVAVFIPTVPVVTDVPIPTPPVHPVYIPPSAPEPEGTSWFWLAAAGASGGGLVLSLAVLFMVVRKRRRRATPVARAKASAGRLQRRLKGDQVKARLLIVVKDLAEESASLEMVERKLERAVRNANPEALKKRHEELERAATGLDAHGGVEAGAGDLHDAAAIVEKQIDRCRQWEMQRWRSAARMERIATRLEALEAELNDPAQGKLGEADSLLETLHEELELARSGEREAEKLLGRAPDDPSGSAAA